MKKKLENIWYYHKFIIILAAVVLAAVLFVLLQNVGKTTPEEQVGIISTDGYSDESLKKLEQAFSGMYGHEVQVKLYPVELGAEGQDIAVIGALDADLAAKVSSTFLLKNVASFREATNNLKITDPVPVSDINEIQGLGFDNLYLVTRIYD